MSAGHDATERKLAGSIRALLEGTAPHDLTPSDLRAYGVWDQTMAALVEAHGRGGTAAVRDVLLALARCDGRLMEIMAGDPQPKPTAWTLRELLYADFPPPEFIVEGLLPVGLSNLAGRPKVGKSLLANQIALAVDSGVAVLGRKTVQAKVFYLALEDSPGRLADRLKRLLRAGGLHIPREAPAGPEGVAREGVGVGESRFVVASPRLGEGGLEQIGEALEAGHRLVVIDTFSRACGRADQMDSAEMTAVMGALQRMALDAHAAILLVDHHRKSARTAVETDPIDDIYGSTAKAGVVDCALGLYRRHNEDDGMLKLSGRDFGDSEVLLRWDAERFTWELRTGEEQGAAGDQARLTERDYQTLAAVEELRAGTLTQIAGVTGEAKGNLYHRLAELCRKGALLREGDGKGTVYRTRAQGAGAGAGYEVMDVMEVMNAGEDDGAGA